MQNNEIEIAPHKIVSPPFEKLKIDFEIHQHTGIRRNEFVCDDNFSKYTNEPSHNN